MDCTLWDSLSVQFIEFYNKLTDLGPVVLIIKHARVKEPQGNYPLQLTNVWDGTQLLFDQTIPEIKAFLSRFNIMTTNASKLLSYFLRRTFVIMLNS
ncbi:replication protein A 70 kDa DNA-binding subunit C-like [Trifolium medium]|uniref:Replication protein A 70 kDa DNA-binding subunit C-like n=1 Tax=Trifolium medium TaxID=97028 RepID=A0A392R2E4_9FABA|nr:replication protein A 70 kDa DNA-binding subunit C-like [Trifolium medium]